jgi:hypothetical protein
VRKKQRNTGESLTRVQSFLDAHADILGALTGTPARRQLNDAVAALGQHALAQDSATLTGAAVAERAKQATDTLRAEYMGPIAAFARKSLRGAPDFAALTRSPRKKAGHALVAAARAMATAATPLAAQFTQASFPADLLDQFARQADLLDAASAQRTATVASRIGAGSGVEKALASGREAIGMLDPIVTRMLRSSELLASWRAVKRVVNVPSAATVTSPTAPIAPAASPASLPSSTAAPPEAKAA